ncbi:hypothetical protein MJO28_011440 [Puccinia striiformis f. sp. tritici]|uniref:Autophagy-related protein 9 n=2 Tax=Puccinia striiformis f. sp. tritici TaxID=168172 RepID=A0A0L0VBK9_9BASI|nr:hypothetical protein Pst134EB_021888 [Puccinia striiformis f. sp. tritici]KAI7943912.1 hypothetical protein MJO28_011440 [Puccinia striiformis f. sp. tritici]KAI7946681.1 hypothetical protein MJO29_011208 [Puccinia striiformis f. sp. tritici]KNE96665.1 hypothetical protein PSTG_10069 [Puccinia striiformis f. sp. tritici PST-78]
MQNENEHENDRNPFRNFQDGPGLSMMIDIQRREEEAEDSEDSASPSPSLTRHPIEQQKLNQSILHHHRPPPAAASLLLPQQQQQQQTPTLFAKLRQIWNQERDQYFGLNSFSHHNQQQQQQQRTTQDGIQTLSPKEMALWRWVNVDDLDSFLQDVYSYYVGNGIYAIGLSRLCNLMTVGFVIGFSIFLFGCIDYNLLKSSHHLHEVIVPQCVSRFSGLTLLLVLAFSGYYSWRVLKFGHEISKLWKMHEFFTELLEVTEADIQTIPWYRLVEQLSRLKDSHPATIATEENEGRGRRDHQQRIPVPSVPNMNNQSVLQRKLDAHDVANQIMREQNYLIALFNKDILDLRPPLPNWMVGNILIADKHLTTSLEWNLLFSLRGFLLDSRGQVKPEYLVSSRVDPTMALRLQRRFKLMAIINLIFGPFIVVYVLIYSFFRYFEEYHKNPSSIGSRSFTRLARWKFREYNELPHLFQERLESSYSLSKRYIDHFPKTKTTILAKFVSFIAGSFAGVLIVLSLWDPDLFLHFEISSERSVIFYIGLFGSILAISRGMIKEEKSPSQEEGKIENPGELMERIINLTHYLPNHWYGKLHGLEVFNDFGKLFQLKIIIFVNELMSILLTPFILWFNFDLDRSQKIIDFFREFTIHVDGIGYVCSFSVFDFNRLEIDTSPGPSANPQLHRHPTAGTRVGQPPAPMTTAPPTTNLQQNDINKMERSLLSFVAHHPNWEPSNQTASLYLSKAIGFSTTVGDSMVHPHPHLHPPAPPALNNHHQHYSQQSGSSQTTSPVRHRSGGNLTPFGHSYYQPQQPKNGYLASIGRSHLAGQHSLLASVNESQSSGPATQHSFLHGRPSPIGALRNRTSKPTSLGPGSSSGGTPSSTIPRSLHPPHTSSASSSSSHVAGSSTFKNINLGKHNHNLNLLGVQAIDEEDPILHSPINDPHLHSSSSSSSTQTPSSTLPQFNYPNHSNLLQTSHHHTSLQNPLHSNLNSDALNLADLSGSHLHLLHHHHAPSGPGCSDDDDLDQEDPFQKPL